MTHEVFKDCFNMLCGDKLGEGIHREVFECRLRPDLVVKIESAEARYFANVLEMRFWYDQGEYKPVGKWLAPCEFLSPDGRLLLQRKCDPVPSNFKLPKRLPEFITDTKIKSFGLLDGNLVLVDYGIVIDHPSVKLREVEFW